MGNKKKKEKITYMDDGRSLADMSRISSPGLSGNTSRYRASFKEQWKTYTEAVRMMVKPMLLVILALCVAYGVLYLLLSLA